MRQRRFFSKQVKDHIVQEYVSGKKTSTQLSQEYGIPVNFVYRWYAERRPNPQGSVSLQQVIQKLDPVQSEIDKLREELNRYKIKIAELLIK